MSKVVPGPRRANRASLTFLRIPLMWFWRLMLLLWLAAAGSVGAAQPEEQYLQAYTLMDRADHLSQNGQTNAAKAKYREAQAGLLKLKSDSPTWNPKMVSFRLDYLNEKIAALSRPAPVPEPLASPATQTPKEPEHQPSALPPDVQVRLLHPGAAPRKVLFLQPTPEEKQTVIVIGKSSMSMMGGESPLEMKMPALKMTASALPRNAGAGGDIPCEFTIDDVQITAEAGTAPEVVEEMKQSMGQVKGLVIDCVTTDRCYVRKSEPRIPAGASAETKEAMREVADNFASEECVLPKEAVGVGARWEVRQKIRSGGMVVDQSATHQLVSLDGDVLTINSTIIEQAANQKVPHPLEPGKMADLVKMTGSSSGTTTMSLTKMLPLRAAGQEHSEATTARDLGGQKQTLTIKSDSTTLVESK